VLKRSGSRHSCETERRRGSRNPTARLVEKIEELIASTTLTASHRLYSPPGRASRELTGDRAASAVDDLKEEELAVFACFTKPEAGV